MTSVEFGKKCQRLNEQYKDIFGYVPCRGDYMCSQDDYFDALIKAIATEKELPNFVKKRHKYNGRD